MGGLPRVLIVDDSELALEVTAGVLSDAGLDPICVSDASSVAQVIGATAPQLVLVDHTMDPLSGEDVIKRLLLDRPNEEFPILLFSGRPSEELKQAVDRCGADGFIQKSDDDAEFVKSLRSWLAFAAWPDE